MTKLDSEKSWELLLKKAFTGSTNVQCPEELESIGRQISKKCGGLPLAISVVGGLLVETQSVSIWKEVLNHLHSNLEKAENGLVSSILELSYQNLPPQLKVCFLCLSFFKEDFTIPAKRLVNIWDGHGLIQQEGSRRIDEIGRDYVNELINRSMLQIEYIRFDGQVKYCRLHDLVRDMCIRKAKEEIYLEFVRDGIKDVEGSSYKPRHRVVYGVELGDSSLDKNKHIRSLFLLTPNVCKCIPSPYWKSLKLLKTLDLYEIGLGKLPDTLRLLIGLKNLRIWDRERLEIPSWLDQLISLKVLEVEAGVEFPNVALKMKKLRYWHVKGMYGSSVMKIKEWENIESLKGMSQKDWLECSSSLIASSHLRKLCFSIQSATEDELNRLRESLGKMEKLEELHLKFYHWGSVNYNGLLPNGVTKLKLRFGFNCPAASEFPPNLTHLTLFCNGGEGAMEELGKLPKLQYLKLTIRGPIKVLHDGFPCLEALCLIRMNHLRSIDIEEGGMPRLKHIQLIYSAGIDTRNLPRHIIISTAPEM